MLEYINTKYSPKPTDLVALYYLEPNQVSFEEAAEQLAAESSIGTWTDICTLNKTIAKTLKPSVFYLNKREGIIKVAYNEDLFERGNMPQIYSAIAGNIFGMKIVKNLRLLDIHFTKNLVKSFPGPAYGIKGIRKILRVTKRPLTGTIIKPKVGLNEEGHARVAYEAWAGGLDIVKDDENLTSMRFNNFEKRVQLTLKTRDKAEKITGERKMYMPNVTAETSEMIRRAKHVKKLGGEYVMIDILTAGWSGLQSLRQEDLGLVIHAHRAMHAAITRNEKHGISMLTLAKSARLIGVDQIHIGTVIGKMEGSAIETEETEDGIEKALVKADDKAHVLRQEWFNKKPVFAVCSGGLHPGHTPKLLQLLGTDIIAQYGGGCHGHPDGTAAGAKAIRQSIDAAMKGVSLKEFSKNHRELRKALEKWA